MYNTLPFGPATLPTGPILAMFAVIVALELAGRTGRRLGIHPDDVWNTGLFALVAGLIVARLWTIIQFFPVYRAEPMLMLSLRPSGFALWPGVVAGLVVGFGNMVRLSLDPMRVLAAFAVGLVGGGMVLNISGFLTGAVLGAETTVPWAARYFIERVHPLGLYRAAGLLILAIICLYSARKERPLRTLWLALLGYALVHLVTDAWLRDAVNLGAFRRSQVVALVLAVFAAGALALEATVRRTPIAPAAQEPLPGTPTDAAPQTGVS